VQWNWLQSFQHKCFKGYQEQYALRNCSGEVKFSDSVFEDHNPIDEETLGTGLQSSTPWHYCNNKSQAMHLFFCQMLRDIWPC